MLAVMIQMAAPRRTHRTGRVRLERSGRPGALRVVDLRARRRGRRGLVPFRRDSPLLRPGPPLAGGSVSPVGAADRHSPPRTGSWRPPLRRTGRTCLARWSRSRGGRRSTAVPRRDREPVVGLEHPNVVRIVEQFTPAGAAKLAQAAVALCVTRPRWLWSTTRGVLRSRSRSGRFVRLIGHDDRVPSRREHDVDQLNGGQGRAGGGRANSRIRRALVPVGSVWG